MASSFWKFRGGTAPSLADSPTMHTSLLSELTTELNTNALEIFEQAVPTQPESHPNAYARCCFAAEVSPVASTSSDHWATNRSRPAAFNAQAREQMRT